MIAEMSLNRIWEGCKINDRKQQELLYKVLAPKMLAVCMRYTTDRDEAQDVMQEGFIKIFKNLHNYRGEGSLEGWIRRIMAHTAISRYRKLKPIMLTEDMSENSVPCYTSEQNNNVDAKELMNIIQQLPGNYRSVFNLYAIEGYSHQEIGTMLGISELLSRTTLHRARGILRKKVTQLEAYQAN
ncbi:sigma-70 family RNA polymerase sigma factor [Mucilaginibacter sp. R11]|uniref:Sigma-70 family RNA polymerase sigma factor n=2 Tax=Mucilaginibacter agri TaxID=2695265 RepID=A0A965ZDS3_9SPHI|nr:sigma-70 family RNA polymerase sigma factor [Mucilaginibacter agri]